MKTLLLAIILLKSSFVFAVTGNYLSLFGREKILEITIQGKFPKIKTSQKGNIIYNDGFRRWTEKVELEPRGKTRQACPLSPFKIILNKNRSERTPLFSNIRKKLKFVTNCRIKQQEGLHNEILLREFAIYKIINKLGFASFKVRLAKVTYVNNNNVIVDKGFGFFIENKKDALERMGFRIDKSFQSRSGIKETKVLDSVSSDLKERYQLESKLIKFIFGATDRDDFSWCGGQNSHSVLSKEGHRFMCLYYDFDFADIIENPIGFGNIFQSSENSILNFYERNTLYFLRTPRVSQDILLDLVNRYPSILKVINNLSLTEPYKVKLRSRFLHIKSGSIKLLKILENH